MRRRFARAMVVIAALVAVVSFPRVRARAQGIEPAMPGATHPAVSAVASLPTPMPAARGELPLAMTIDRLPPVTAAPLPAPSASRVLQPPARVATPPGPVLVPAGRSVGGPLAQAPPQPLPAPNGRVAAPAGEEVPGQISPEVLERLTRLEQEIVEAKRQLDEQQRRHSAPALGQDAAAWLNSPNGAQFGLPPGPEPNPGALLPWGVPGPGSPAPWGRLIGELQTDVIGFSQSPLNKQSVGDALNGVDFRRARLAAVGQMTDFNDYRLEMDFAEPGRPRFLDVYLTQQMLPVVSNFRVGHFFEPFCMSRINDNRFDTFMERPLLTVFAPARRTGFGIFGVTDDLSATWAGSIYTSNDDFFGGNLTDVGGWAGAGRLTWVPYYDAPSGGRHYLHLGGAYSLSGVTNHQLQFATTPEMQLINGNSYEPIFLDTGLLSATQYQLFGVEALWNEGPWSLQSEYIAAPINTIGGPTATLQGAYVMTTYFLTGEHRPYDRTIGNISRVVPFEDFFRVRGPRHMAGGRGAWQLAARWSYLNFNGGDVRAGVLNDITVGVNWYWNPFVRVFFNYIHAILDDPIYGTSAADAFGARFQLDF